MPVLIPLSTDPRRPGRLRCSLGHLAGRQLASRGRGVCLTRPDTAGLVQGARGRLGDGARGSPTSMSPIGPGVLDHRSKNMALRSGLSILLIVDFIY